MNATLSELRDLIRAESGIEGDDTYRVLIDAIINQEYGRLTGKSKNQELLDTESYTVTVDEQFQFTLPTDYQLFDSLLYLKTGGTPDEAIVLSKGVSPRAGLAWSGTPQYWYRSGPYLRVYPYTGTLIGDVLTLSYFKKDILSLDADLMLVSSLEQALILACNARMLKMTDTAKGRLATADANQAFLDARSEAAGS